MEDVKVKVNNEAESKEAQELFFKLGYGWHGKGKKLSYSEKILGYGFGWLVLWKPDYLVNKVIQIGTGFESVKEITIDQLRDMVVLKRNDCNDRTHVDSNNYDWYVASDEKHYRFQGSIWVHQPYVDCLELKPIKKDQSEKEYLDENFNLVYGSGVYEVPEGAELATKCNEHIIFWKEGTKSFSIEDGDTEWQDAKLRPSELYNIHEYLSGHDEASTVWQRNNKCAYIKIGDININLGEQPQRRNDDNVNHPSHYTTHPSGIECIDITRHHDFAIGNAIKYLWRAGLKDSDNEVQDLKKAIWYIQDKINQLGG